MRAMRRSPVHAALCAAIAVAGCGDNSGTGGLPRVAFELPANGETVPVSQVPFPNDLYLDDDGQLDIPVHALPFDPEADPAVLESIAASFAELDCFGPGAGTVFPLAGLEPGDTVLSESLDADSALLIDLERGEIVPSETVVRTREGEVFLRPRRGHVLRPGAPHAAVLTRGAVLASGRSLTAAPDLEAVLHEEGGGHPRLARAARAYAPLRAYLAGPDASLDADDVAGAAVFTTCDHGAEMSAVVDQLDEAEPVALSVDRLWRSGEELDALLGLPDDPRGPGVDNPGGIAHADIGWLVSGSYPAPSYQSATPGALGRFEYGPTGAPLIKGTEQVPFLLALPAELAAVGEVPVVVFQHGLGESKNAVLAVANTLAARGIATIGIDIPFHGARDAEARDRRHNYAEGEGPDGLVDPGSALVGATFFDLLGSEDVPALDPRVQAASVRQAAIDVMVLARLLAEGDLSAIGAAEPELAGLGFRGDRIVYASESFGGFVGVIAVAMEPRYRAAFLAVAGGGLLSDLLENSPIYSELFMPILGGAFEVVRADVDPSYAPAHSHRAYQTLGLVLGGADPLSYAHILPAQGVHVVMANAYSDESVPNQSSEALAAALGLSWAPVPGATEGPEHVPAEALPVAELPLAGNREAGGRALTAGAFALHPATHGMMTRQRGERRFAIGFPPFEGLPEPEPVDNPIVELQAHLAGFTTSYLEHGVPRLGDDD